MEQVKMGRSGLKVSQLGLGSMGFGSPKWMAWVMDEAESRPYFKRALDLGITYFDTADGYSHGAAEEVVVGDINDELGTEVCGLIGADNAAYMHLDVTDPEACQAAVEFAVEKFGGVDCVLNSAVKMAPGLLKDLPLENWNLS